MLKHQLDVTEEFIERAKREWEEAERRAYGAEQAYYAAVDQFLFIKLIEKKVWPGAKVLINFSDGKEICIYGGPYRDEIKIYRLTKKGKPYKTPNRYPWTYYKIIDKVDDRKLIKKC